MLMEVQIQSLRVRKYGTDLLIERRVLRGSLAPEQRRDQYRNCCNLQSTQAADGKHGGLLLDWIEYHPVSEARHFQGNLWHYSSCDPLIVSNVGSPAANYHRWHSHHEPRVNRPPNP